VALACMVQLQWGGCFSGGSRTALRLLPPAAKSAAVAVVGAIDHAGAYRNATLKKPLPQESRPRLPRSGRFAASRARDGGVTAPGRQPTLLRSNRGAYKATAIGASAIRTILYQAGTAGPGRGRRAPGGKVGSDRDANDAAAIGADARAIGFLAALTGRRGANKRCCKRRLSDDKWKVAFGFPPHVVSQNRTY
jgi:hypothetical protein